MIGLYEIRIIRRFRGKVALFTLTHTYFHTKITYFHTTSVGVNNTDMLIVLIKPWQPTQVGLVLQFQTEIRLLDSRADASRSCGACSVPCRTARTVPLKGLLSPPHSQPRTELHRP